MEPLRIGFVGAGSMGQCAHLKNYATLSECRVVALAELRPELRRRVAERYGIPATYADHRDMLSRERLDGIVAAQPFTRHGLLVPELVASGVPVFIEKPLAGSVQVGERVLAAVQSSGAWLMVGYHKRCDPATTRVKAEVEELKASGELGAMRYVRVSMPAGEWIVGGFDDLIRTEEPVPDLPSDAAPPDMDAETYRAYLRFVNYYIHQVNLLRHLLGEPYRVTHADPSGVLLAAESRSGLPAILEMTPYRTTIDWQESALVAFERGYLRLDLPAPLANHRPGRVELLRDPGDGVEPTTTWPHLPSTHAMREEALAFLRAIRGQADPPCGAEEALEDLRVARDYIRMLHE